MNAQQLKNAEWIRGLFRDPLFAGRTTRKT